MSASGTKRISLLVVRSAMSEKQPKIEREGIKISRCFLSGRSLSSAIRHLKKRCYLVSNQITVTRTFSPITSVAINIMHPAVMKTPVTPLIPKSKPPNAAPAAIED